MPTESELMPFGVSVSDGDVGSIIILYIPRGNLYIRKSFLPFRANRSELRDALRRTVLLCKAARTHTRYSLFATSVLTAAIADSYRSLSHKAKSPNNGIAVWPNERRGFYCLTTNGPPKRNR